MLADQQVAIDAKAPPGIWIPTLFPALPPLNIVSSVGDHPLQGDQDQKNGLHTMVSLNLEATTYGDQAFETSLPVTFTQIIQVTSAMAVQTQSRSPLQPHSVTYVAAMYPDLFLPYTINTKV